MCREQTFRLTVVTAIDASSSSESPIQFNIYPANYLKLAGQVQNLQKETSKKNQNEEYATRGPFASIFGGPSARLFDQALIVGNMEQTITMLSESTNLSYKTTKEALKKLIKMGFVAPTRKIGNAQAYRFLVENHMSTLLSCGAEFQRNRTDI